MVNFKTIGMSVLFHSSLIKMCLEGKNYASIVSF